MKQISQELVEALYSPSNRRAVLRSAIMHEMNHAFCNWFLRAHSRLHMYLNHNWWESKQIRINELKASFTDKTADDLFCEIILAIVRSGRNPTIQTVLGHIVNFMPHEDKEDNLKTGAELIAIACGTQEDTLFRIVRPQHLESPLIECTRWDQLNRIFGDALEWIEDTFFNPPLVEKPLHVKSNKNCGYHTIDVPLVLGNETMHDMPLDYEVINLLNSWQWVLDEHVMAEEEPPAAPIESLEDERNHKQHMKQADKIYNLLGDRTFYMTWQFDSRGRMYSHGHHVNLQSHEYKKAMLNFNNYEVLT